MSVEVKKTVKEYSDGLDIILKIRGKTMKERKLFREIVVLCI